MTLPAALGKFLSLQCMHARVLALQATPLQSRVDVLLAASSDASVGCAEGMYSQCTARYKTVRAQRELSSPR